MRVIKNDRLLKALRREPVDYTPIWIMRQAGRYLPEYRKTRANAGSFMRLCQTPELACEVTLQPLRRFNLDAAIIFSDILTIPDALGLGLHFVEGEGPQFKKPVQTEDAVNRLPELDLSALEYVYDAISLTQQELAGKVPLIGFTGSPFTLAAYMIEGRSQQGFPLINQMRENAPHILHNLLSKLATAITLHLKAQIQAGADVVMIFDTWGGLLNTVDYTNFSLPYLKQILDALRHASYNKENTSVILFTKGGGAWLEQMAALQPTALGLDWNISLAEARKRVGSKVALQGNLDPSILLETPEVIQGKVAEVLAAFGSGSGHVFNLGHGITPDVPPEHVNVLVEAVHEVSKAYHK